jgi:hypothetical protein
MLKIPQTTSKFTIQLLEFVWFLTFLPNYLYATRRDYVILLARIIQNGEMPLAL